MPTRYLHFNLEPNPEKYHIWATPIWSMNDRMKTGVRWGWDQSKGRNVLISVLYASSLSPDTAYSRGSQIGMPLRCVFFCPHKYFTTFELFGNTSNREMLCKNLDVPVLLNSKHRASLSTWQQVQLSGVCSLTHSKGYTLCCMPNYFTCGPSHSFLLSALSL